MKKLKIETNKKLIISGICISAFAILFYLLFQKWNVWTGMIGVILSAFSPFFIGIAFALLLNIPMKRIEEKIQGMVQWKQNIIHIVSVIITVIIAALLIIGTVWLIVPTLIDNISEAVKYLPGAIEKTWDDIYIYLIEREVDIPSIINSLYQNIDWTKTINQVINGFTNGILNSSVNIVIGLLQGVFNILFGVVIAIYILTGKEKFKQQGKKVLFAFIKKKHARTLINVLQEAYRLLNAFIYGKLIDSLLMGILTAIGMFLFGIPYIGILATWVAVTNILPVIGPFIALVTGTILLCFVDMRCAIIFLIYVNILQQLDGNVFGPKIIGNQLELPGFWTLFAIFAGGAFLGPIGMFLGIPIFALIYASIKEFVHDRLDEKGIKIE